MGNPFFNALGGGRRPMPGGPNMQNLQAQIAKLKQQYSNPQDAIQQLMNSGRVTQDQYNAAVQRARQIQQMLGGK